MPSATYETAEPPREAHFGDSFEDQLRAHTIVALPAAPSDLAPRDPDDAWVLASALAGGAELLVTGDKDRMSVADRSPLAIVNPRACWDRLRRAG
jgi:predicted nucleic acid-binding protein